MTAEKVTKDAEKAKVESVQQLKISTAKHEQEEKMNEKTNEIMTRKETEHVGNIRKGIG